MEDTAHESSVLPRLELGGRGSEADDVVPFADSIELLSKSGLPESALIDVGWDHRLADPEPLEALLRAVEAG